MSVSDLTPVETVKAALREYSRFMRRDFLAILVKMSAKYFNIRTVRCDWRTRTGMVAFLQGIWEKFFPLLSEDSIFNWYCTNFDSLEKLFSERKFMMFVFSKWEEYKNFFKSQETLAFMKQNEDSILVLVANPKSQHPAQFDTETVGQEILKIIDQYSIAKVTLGTSGHSANPLSIPRPSTMPKSNSMPAMTQMQKQIHQLHAQQKLQQQLLLKQKMAANQQQMALIPQQTTTSIPFTPLFKESKYLSADVSDTDTADEELPADDLFDPLNFELGEYDPDSVPLITPRDYPYSMDLYSL